MFTKLLSILLLFYGACDGFNHCTSVPSDLSPQVWKNEGAAIIYVMKSSQQNWQTHVTWLLQLLQNLKNIDVTTNLIIVTDKNCSAFENISEFKIQTGDIWEKMQHPNQYPEALVIDRCGRITYHIIFPWSLVKWFPFIKGAVLSTFFDKPCGLCQHFDSPTKTEIQVNEMATDEIKIYPEMSHVARTASDEVGPPIQIIIREKHKHKGSDEIFQYTEMELGNKQYHRHFHDIDDLEFTPPDQDENSVIVNKDNLNSLRPNKSGKGESQQANHFKHSTYKTKRNRADNTGEQDKDTLRATSNSADLERKINEIIAKCTGKANRETEDKYYQKLFENILKTVYAPEEKFSKDETDEREELSHHYEKLNNWISYIV